MRIRLQELKEINYRYDSMIEKIDLENDYEKEQILVQFIFLRIQPKQIEIAEHTVDYIIKNFSKLYQTAISTFAYYNELSFPSDEERGKRSLKEFFGLIQKRYDVKCYVIINCKHVKDGLARYSFVVNGENDFCEQFGNDGLELVMEKDEMIFFDSANSEEATEIEDYIEDYQEEMKKRVARARKAMNRREITSII